MAKKKKSKTKKVLVKRKSLLNLFRAMGFSKPEKWDNTKLLQKVVKLPETTENVKIHKKAARDFLKKLLKIKPLSRVTIEDTPEEKKKDKEAEKAIKDAKKQKKAKKKDKQPDRVTVTTNVLTDLPNSGLSISQLTTKCDNAFVKAGGKETVKEAACCLRRIITCLKIVKIIKQDGNKIVPARKR